MWYNTLKLCKSKQIFKTYSLNLYGIIKDPEFPNPEEKEQNCRYNPFRRHILSTSKLQ